MKTQKTLATKPADPKALLIERLLAKASLDFKCCGHGHIAKPTAK